MKIILTHNRTRVSATNTPIEDGYPISCRIEGQRFSLTREQAKEFAELLRLALNATSADRLERL